MVVGARFRIVWNFLGSFCCLLLQNLLHAQIRLFSHWTGVWAALTEYHHRMGGYQSKIKVPSGLVLGDVTLGVRALT